jgi:hypothetical protein
VHSVYHMGEDTQRVNSSFPRTSSEEENKRPMDQEDDEIDHSECLDRRRRPFRCSVAGI